MHVVAMALALSSPALLANPQQPWASPDGMVHLLRPMEAAPSTSTAGFGSMMVSGWRLLWDDSTAAPPIPGRIVVRLVLKVKPTPPETDVSEVLQVGVSRDPAAVRTCLTYGFQSASSQRRPDRIINGRRYAVWASGDSSMSQGIAATELRTMVDGACYAVERFTYSLSGSDVDPTITLPQARGAQELDAALASLQLGPLQTGQILQRSSIGKGLRLRADDGSNVRLKLR